MLIERSEVFTAVGQLGCDWTFECSGPLSHIHYPTTTVGHVSLS